MDSLNLLYDFSPLLMLGLRNTLLLWLGATLISLNLGFLSGFFRCEQMRSKGFSKILDWITIILMGIPLYVQILLVYFVLPSLIKININAFWAGVIALGLCSSVYISEIVRSGINVINKSQWEAAFSLGSTKGQCIFYIILPQMIRNVLPPIISELVAVMKSTSILATIGTLELTKVGQNIVARSMDPIFVYCCMALIYLFLNGIISFLGKYIEKKLA
jgi:polar amino acid transport system permease protein